MVYLDIDGVQTNDADSIENHVIGFYIDFFGNGSAHKDATLDVSNVNPMIVGSDDNT